MHRPDITVIIPTYNRTGHLIRCINSILYQVKSPVCHYELIIALDMRDTDTEPFLMDNAYTGFDMRVARARRPGVNAARNAGIEKAQGEIIVFLDDDCIVPRKDWLLDIYRYFEHHPDIAALGGGYALGAHTNILSICRNKLDNYYLNLLSDNLRGRSALVGGNCAYRRDAFQKYGIFDERIRYGSAETEMNDRIILQGGRIAFFPELSIIHETASKIWIIYLMKSFHQGRGKAYSLKKNGSLTKEKYGLKKIWFFEIGRTAGRSWLMKTAMIMCLFCLSVLFWAGFWWGVFVIPGSKEELYASGYTM